MMLTTKRRGSDASDGPSGFVGSSQTLQISTKSGGYYLEEDETGALSIYCNGVERLLILPDGHSAIRLRIVNK